MRSCAITETQSSRMSSRRRTRSESFSIGLRAMIPSDRFSTRLAKPFDLIHRQDRGRSMSIKPATIRQVTREALAVHETLRKLSFSPDNIFFVVSDPLEEPESVRGLTEVRVALIAQGKRFDVTIGFVRE